MHKPRWFQFNVRMLLLLTGAVALLLALLIPPLTRDKTYGYSKVNVLTLPSTTLAREAEQLDFVYQISPDIRVGVKGWVAQPGDPSLNMYSVRLEPTDALFTVSVTRDPGTRRWVMPYTRKDFMTLLETEVNRRLRISDGTRVTKLTLGAYYAGR